VESPISYTGAKNTPVYFCRPDSPVLPTSWGFDVVRHPLYIIERFLKVVRILVVSHLDSSGHNGKTTVVCNGLLTEKMVSALTLPHIKHGYHSSGANLFQGDG